MKLLAFTLFIAGFWLLISGVAASEAAAQNVTVSTLAGGSGPLDGQGTAALFTSPWQVQVKDSLAFFSDKDNDALRVMSLKTKIVKTILTGQNNISGLALSSTGDSIFFCSNSNVLKRFVRSTQTLTKLDSIPDTDVDAIACTRNGKLLIGSVGGHRLAEWSGPGLLVTLAGKFGQAGLVDGIDTVARFNRIASILLSQTEDTIFISDRFNSKIRRYIRTTRLVSSLNTGNLLLGPRQLAFSRRKDTIFVGNSSKHCLVSVPLKAGAAAVFCGASGVEGYIDGIATASRFSFPMGIARSDSGWVICDNGNRRIRLFKNGLTRTIAGAGFIGDGIGTASRFNVPYDLVKHPLKDSVYISDQNNHAIRLINLNTKEVKTLVGNGISGNVSSTNPALVRLNRPTNFAMSPSGDTLFFVEPFANKIKYLLTKTNTVRLLAGSDTAGYRDYPAGRYAHFNRPQDLAYRDGFLYISDALNHKIRKIRISSTEVTTFAGTSAGFKDSTIAGAKFNRPATLEWIGNNLWVGEDAGLKIRVIKPDEDTVIRWAGSGNIGTADGPGANARFMGIFKISYDPFRRGLLVGGYQNEGICRFVSIDTALVSTFFNATGFADGPLASAKFLGPMGYWADIENQFLLFTDAGNNRIRKLQFGLNRRPTCVFDTASVNNLLEDQALVSLPSVVSNLSPGNGPLDSLQTVSIQVESVPPGKVINASVNAAGTLQFQPAPDSNGVFLLKVRLKDNGGTQSGGVDTSLYFKTVQVKAVNDAPIFKVISNDTASNGAARVRPGFLLKLTPGPSDESWQSLDTTITCSRPDWFSVLPSFDGDTLRFEPIADTLGTCDVFVRLKDNGGLADGGVDSLNTGFTITLLDPSSVKGRISIRPSLQIFPNPAAEFFMVRNLPASCRSLSVYDLKGVKLKELKPDDLDRFFTGDILPGIYVLRAGGVSGAAGILRVERK
jgi:hypothetical protein